jgi:hypothetical protein
VETSPRAFFLQEGKLVKKAFKLLILLHEDEIVKSSTVSPPALRAKCVLLILGK